MSGAIFNLKVALLTNTHRASILFAFPVEDRSRGENLSSGHHCDQEPEFPGSLISAEP